MKAAVVLLLLLFVTTYSLEIQVTSETPQVTSTNSYIWLLRRSIMKGSPTIGFYVNKTVYAFQGLSPLAGVCYGDEQATQLYYEIFDMLPLVRGALDENAYLGKIQGQAPPTYYLINPQLGNKWVMSNISHVYQYGIDESKALLVNQDLLSRYPTAYYF